MGVSPELSGLPDKSNAVVLCLHHHCCQTECRFPVVFSGKDTATKDTAELKSGITDVRCLKRTSPPGGSVRLCLRRRVPILGNVTNILNALKSNHFYFKHMCTLVFQTPTYETSFPQRSVE